MIKGTGTEKDGVPFLLLGLSAGNCRDLLAGHPIRIRVDHVDPRLAPLAVMLMGGETETDMVADIGRYVKLPPTVTVDGVPGPPL